MKITKSRLKEIIKEEVEEVLKEDLSRLYPIPDPEEIAPNEQGDDGVTEDDGRPFLEEAIALKSPGKNFDPIGTKDPRTDIVNANIGKRVGGLGLNDYLRKNVKGEWTARNLGHAGINTVNSQDGEKAYNLVRIQLSKSPKEILKEALQNKEILAKLEREGLVKNITVPIDYIDSIRD